MKRGTLFITIGLLLIAAVLYITGYNILGSAAPKQLVPKIAVAPAPVEARREKYQLPPEEITHPDYVLYPEMEMSIETIDNHDYIGALTIPVIDLALPILSEWSYPDLKISPCRYVGSAYLGNLAIAAHSFRRHFGALNTLSIGDAVFFTDMAGNEFEYRVSEIETLQPTAVEDLKTGDRDLTLFTCTLAE